MSPTKRLEPQPPELLPPWRTAARVELQLEARAFARELCSQLRTSLTPRKAKCPGVSWIRWPRRAGSALPSQLNTEGWGSACWNTALYRRNSRALGFPLAASWRGARDSARKQSMMPAGSNCCAARPEANGSGPSRCLNPQSPPSALFPRAANSHRRGWLSFARRLGLCSPGLVSPRRVNPARLASKHFWWSNSPARFPKA
jgi:hypothetical protein